MKLTTGYARNTSFCILSKFKLVINPATPGFVIFCNLQKKSVIPLNY